MVPQQFQDLLGDFRQGEHIVNATGTDRGTRHGEML
jgi:hypothetical protein